MLTAATVVSGVSTILAEDGEAGRQLYAQARCVRLPWRLEIGWVQRCARSARGVFLNLVSGEIHASDGCLVRLAFERLHSDENTSKLISFVPEGASWCGRHSWNP